MKQDLVSEARIWDWHLAPDCVKERAAMNGDDVDWLAWFPEHFEGNPLCDALGTLGETHWKFFFEEDAQDFLGPNHRGDGFFVTVTHA